MNVYHNSSATHPTMLGGRRPANKTVFIPPRGIVSDLSPVESTPIRVTVDGDGQRAVEMEHAPELPAEQEAQRTGSRSPSPVRHDMPEPYKVLQRPQQVASPEGGRGRARSPSRRMRSRSNHASPPHRGKRSRSRGPSPFRGARQQPVRNEYYHGRGGRGGRPFYRAGGSFYRRRTPSPRREPIRKRILDEGLVDMMTSEELAEWIISPGMGRVFVSREDDHLMHHIRTMILNRGCDSAWFKSQMGPQGRPTCYVDAFFGLAEGRMPVLGQIMHRIFVASLQNA